MGEAGDCATSPFSPHFPLKNFLTKFLLVIYQTIYVYLLYPAVDVTGDRSKVRCCKEQYCIGTWNVRSMNPGKLEVVKQEMARVNVNILGISELKWTRMGEFNSNDHYIYYCGQKSLRRNGVAIMVNKRVRNQYLDAISKTTEWSLFVSKANHSISQ